MQSNKKSIDKWFYIPILILALNFLYRLIDQSKIIKYFPFDKVNDVSSYMAQLFFLSKCGFHNFCGYWYNGFTTFSFSPPGWYFFTLPLYLLTKDVKSATYISMILLFILGFIVIWFFGRLYKLSIIKRIAFFLFFYTNAIVIGNFIRLGRVHELFSWVMFSILAFIVIQYKDKKLDKNFLWFVPIYSIIIFSYQSIAVLSTLLILGLFLVKNKKEKLFVLLATITSFILSAFWWLPFLLNIENSSILYFKQAKWLLIFTKEHLFTNIAAFIIPLVLLVLSYIYWKDTKKSRKELIFYSPILLLAIVFLFRIIHLIPLLQNIFPDITLTFFLFFIIFLFFKINWQIYNMKIKRIIFILLIIFSVTSVAINIIHTPKFMIHNEIDKDVITVLSKVEGRFIMVQEVKDEYPYSNAVYSFAPIYYNINTAGGWYHHLTNIEYLNDLDLLRNLFDSKNCNNFLDQLNKLNISEVISYDNSCEFLNSCGLKEKFKKGNVCLFKI